MYGLVLAGGGAKGAFQIGAWKALDELGIEIGAVAGTSVGALNGAFYAQRDYDIALKMWSNIEMSHVFEADETLIEDIKNIAEGGIGKTNLQLFKKAYDHIIKNKGLNISPLRNMTENLLDEEKLRNSGIDFGLVTLNIDKIKPLRIFADEIPKGELKYYLLGSALVPGFIQDEKSPMKFVDGGVYDNFPITMIKEKGYKKIIAINLHNKKAPRIEGVEIIYIKPSESLGNFLYFDKQKSVNTPPLN